MGKGIQCTIWEFHEMLIPPQFLFLWWSVFITIKTSDTSYPTRFRLGLESNITATRTSYNPQEAAEKKQQTKKNNVYPTQLQLIVIPTAERSLTDFLSDLYRCGARSTSHIYEYNMHIACEPNEAVENCNLIPREWFPHLTLALGFKSSLCIDGFLRCVQVVGFYSSCITVFFFVFIFGAQLGSGSNLSQHVSRVQGI